MTSTSQQIATSEKEYKKIISDLEKNEITKPYLLYVLPSLNCWCHLGLGDAVMIGERNSSRYIKWKFLKRHGIIRHTVCWQWIYFPIGQYLLYFSLRYFPIKLMDDLPCTTSAQIFVDFLCIPKNSWDCMSEGLQSWLTHSHAKGKHVDMNFSQLWVWTLVFSGV